MTVDRVKIIVFVLFLKTSNKTSSQKMLYIHAIATMTQIVI